MWKYMLFGVLVSVASQAQRPMEAPACVDIARQCETAGFHPGDHKKDGKGMWVDCVGAVAKGKAVQGVTATADQAKACMAAAKELREKHRQMKAK